MKRYRLLIIALSVPLCAAGCRSMWQDMTKRITPLPVQYRQRAVAHEQAGELQQALLAYEASLLLGPQNRDVTEAVSALKKTISKLSQETYHKGLEHYKAGDFTSARQAFLKAVRINPAHSAARHYLELNLQNPSRATYKVRRGDSFIRIATKVFDDPSKAYMIAYFNGMNPKKPLLTGTVLRLPVLDPAILLPKSNIKSLLVRAQEAFEAGAFEQAAALSGKVLAEIPDHVKARRLADESSISLGMQLMEQERFSQALVQFKAVSANHQLRAQSILMAQRELKRQALAKKIEIAQGYLDRSEFSATMDAAEEILEQHPDNVNAREMLNLAGYASGKALLEKGQEIEAIERLEKVDPSYSDTAQLLSVARARTRAAAETLYRDGVKQFINEDLERAIGTWQQALDLNPNHPKARQDMENAMRLLEKWRELEKPPQK
jgi:tetratricopeptide (TPR) repeat protein